MLGDAARLRNPAEIATLATRHSKAEVVYSRNMEML
jgi:hypothetical protein